jgi:hypothetical protein
MQTPASPSYGFLFGHIVQASKNFGIPIQTRASFKRADICSDAVFSRHTFQAGCLGPSQVVSNAAMGNGATSGYLTIIQPQLVLQS